MACMSLESREDDARIRSKTPGAALIGSMKWLGRPVLVNEINGFASLKISEEISCVTLRIVVYLVHEKD
jgi:hypothetical protein